MVANHQEVEVKCPKCGKAFWFKDNGSATFTLERHVDVHTGKECERSFTPAPRTKHVRQEKR